MNVERKITKLFINMKRTMKLSYHFNLRTKKGG